MQNTKQDLALDHPPKGEELELPKITDVYYGVNEAEEVTQYYAEEEQE